MSEKAIFEVHAHDQTVGGGRTAVWMHPGASFTFKFHGGRAPALNRSWLEALMHTANSPTGLHVVPEPNEETVDERALVG